MTETNTEWLTSVESLMGELIPILTEHPADVVMPTLVCILASSKTIEKKELLRLLDAIWTQ